MNLVFSDSGEDKKKTLISLQWLVALAVSYLLLFKGGEIVQDPRAFAIIVAFFVLILLLGRMSESFFDHKFFAPALVIVDTILIAVAIMLNSESPWDLFMVFFLGLFIAATGGSLIKVLAGCMLVAVLAVVIRPYSDIGLAQLESDTLFRIPFLFGVFILYGYLADQAKREKERAERAEGTEKLKRQLVSALAHDIKNPLGVVMGYAEVLAGKLEQNPATREHLETVQRIQDNSQRIVKLVTGFLDATKAEAGKIELTPVPVELNVLIREVCQQQVGNVRMKEISLSTDLDDHPVEIMGDETQLDRVLWNLIGNAIKFTPQGGAVTVTSRLDNDDACVSVRDTGMGIPKEEINTLFSEFRRLKGAAKVEGTGLGLFIVKTIVEAHGGRVQVESQEGRGSTFTIRLPAKS